MKKCYACKMMATSKKMRKFPSSGAIRDTPECGDCKDLSDVEFENRYKYFRQKRKEEKQ